MRLQDATGRWDDPRVCGVFAIAAAIDAGLWWLALSGINETAINGAIGMALAMVVLGGLLALG